MARQSLRGRFACSSSFAGSADVPRGAAWGSVVLARLGKPGSRAGAACRLRLHLSSILNCKCSLANHIMLATPQKYAPTRLYTQSDTFFTPIPVDRVAATKIFSRLPLIFRKVPKCLPYDTLPSASRHQRASAISKTTSLCLATR